MTDNQNQNQPADQPTNQGQPAQPANQQRVTEEVRVDPRPNQDRRDNQRPQAAAPQNQQRAAEPVRPAVNPSPRNDSRDLVSSAWVVAIAIIAGALVLAYAWSPKSPTQNAGTQAPPVQQRLDAQAPPVQPPQIGEPQCDDGWGWSKQANACSRDLRPSKEQRAASFQADKCKPGATREVKKDFIENGREVFRTTTQTCGFGR